MVIEQLMMFGSSFSIRTVSRVKHEAAVKQQMAALTLKLEKVQNWKTGPTPEDDMAPQLITN